MDFCFGVSRLMLRQLLSQAKRISFPPSILSFSFFPFQDICSVLGYVSICTCPVLNRHCMIYKTYARVPLFQQSSQFIFSDRPYQHRLIGDSNRSYKNLNRNWIWAVPSTRYLPISASSLLLFFFCPSCLCALAFHFCCSCLPWLFFHLTLHILISMA